MWYWIISSWLFIALLVWFVFYGASLYDRRSSTARHRANKPLTFSSTPELDDKLDAVIVGE